MLPGMESYDYIREGWTPQSASANVPVSGPMDFLLQAALGGGLGGGGGAAGRGGPLGKRIARLGGSDIEVLHGKNVPGHAGHLHLAAQQGLNGVLKKLEKMGFRVGEHPGYGGVAPVHTSGSHHYSGNAADINYDPGSGRWGSEEQALKWLKRKLQKGLGDQAYYG